MRLTAGDQRARDRLLRWKRDPVAMVREEFQAEPDAWQIDARAAEWARTLGARRILGRATVRSSWGILLGGRAFSAAGSAASGVKSGVTSEGGETHLAAETRKPTTPTASEAAWFTAAETGIAGSVSV